MDTPILFLIFNRPDTTLQVFEAIRKHRPSKLYIAADGPRLTKAGENELCNETRQIASTVDWPCEVKTLYRNKNLGCKVAVSSGIDWFFEQEEEGIILEDDCLPHPDFFRFCKEMLAYYRNDNEVMHIGGTNFQKGKHRGDGSYYFSNYNHIWGWATWRRAWKEYDVNLLGIDEKEAVEILKKTFPHNCEIEFWKKVFLSIMNMNTWDYQWTFTIWRCRGLNIVPNVNLVSNIGIGNGTHHLVIDDPLGLGNMPTHAIGPVKHPSSKGVEIKADTFVHDHYFNPNLFRKIVSRMSHIFKKNQ